MEQNNFPSDFFIHNSFEKIDVALIQGLQLHAEHLYNNAGFKTIKTNCVIVYRQEDDIKIHLKKNLETSHRQARALLDTGINSIIYIFANYPHTVKHRVVTEYPFDFPDYEGKGDIVVVEVSKD